jgi:hypothetical protein
MDCHVTAANRFVLLLMKMTDAFVSISTYTILHHIYMCNICITYSESVFAALGIQHAMRSRHTVICGLPGSTIISTECHKLHDFRKTKLLIMKCVFLISLQLLWKRFSIYEEFSEILS